MTWGRGESQRLLGRELEWRLVDTGPDVAVHDAHRELTRVGFTGGGIDGEIAQERAADARGPMPPKHGVNGLGQLSKWPSRYLRTCSLTANTSRLGLALTPSPCLEGPVTLRRSLLRCWLGDRKYTPGVLMGSDWPFGIHQGRR